ncbi:CBS domain-containing protein [candidate division KSB3 bacterium]|uniref:CBS domain-containing protein n=1 Tax=candidate division KSB3 bacterium TaxID=2044937 RepID=A0A9D5JZB0_9BACT|nr:CBS domain-containing protein [candidate division KSB3 bacterium]MBD3326557.1 CBS domain-containing protein [candidate division KSB3 bacterium]
MMKVGKIVGHQKTIYSTHPENSICEAATLMADKRIGALIVLDDDQDIAGIITERDILRKCAGMNDDDDARCALVKDVMTPKTRLITAHKDHDLRSVMSTMTENNIRHIPILDHDELIGLISIRDVVRILLEHAEFQNKLITEYMDSTGRYL